MDILSQLEALLGPKNTPVQSPNANSSPMLQALTQYQQDLQKRPYLQGPEMYEAFNRQNPREYVGLPQHEDDLFGY